MRPILLTTLLVLSFAVVPSVPAQSFACERAQTVQEKAICANAQLSETDAKMGTAYQRLRASLSPAAAAEIQQDQRAWLDFVKKDCPEKPYHGKMLLSDCLLGVENYRIDDLTHGVRQVEGLHLFRRLRIFTAPNPEKPTSDEDDPGIGIARVTWPEIDRPTPVQAAFNAAAKVAAYRMISSGEGARPGEISPEDVSGVNSDISYHFLGVNSHFVILQLIGSNYGYGAAHPNEFSRTLTWSFDAGHALTERDVFRPSSGWATKLSTLALPLLQKTDQENGRHSLYAAGEVKQGIASVVAEPANWILTQEGLTIDFPEYTVAPRAAGIYSITIPWPALSSLYASGFDPALLPGRLRAGK